MGFYIFVELVLEAVWIVFLIRRGGRVCGDEVVKLIYVMVRVMEFFK